VPKVARAPGARRCVHSSSDYPWLRCRVGSSNKCTSDYPLEWTAACCSWLVTKADTVQASMTVTSH